MPDPLLQEPAAIFLTIVAVIFIVPLLSERARLPGIVGLILGGILFGQHGLHLPAGFVRGRGHGRVDRNAYNRGGLPGGIGRQQHPCPGTAAY